MSRPGNNQPDEDEFAAVTDKVCMDCGKVFSGPHVGEKVPQPGRAKSYKGTEISHSLCKDCYHRRMTAVRGGPRQQKFFVERT